MTRSGINGVVRASEAKAISVNDRSHLESGRGVLAAEAEAVRQVGERLGDEFGRAVETILSARGRVIVTGIGKSGLIGQKIAATFSSTGTPATFLHSVESGHGDLGVVCGDDVILVLSKSGQLDEVVHMIPVFKRLELPIILITGTPDGPMAEHADVVLDASVEREAGPDDLVPTCSTTAALALGDALAVALLEARGFTVDDFALLHPRGALGRRLLWCVADIMHAGDKLPRVTRDTRLQDAILHMTEKRLGMTTVVNEAGRLVGVVTDGDLRRALERFDDPMTHPVAAVMAPHPKTVAGGTRAIVALELMEEHKITSLVVLDDERRPRGVVHMHDILALGIV